MQTVEYNVNKSSKIFKNLEFVYIREISKISTQSKEQSKKEFSECIEVIIRFDKNNNWIYRKYIFRNSHPVSFYAGQITAANRSKEMRKAVETRVFKITD